MGYRFTLETANTVANLTFGKVMACYRDIYSSSECYEGFMQFLSHSLGIVKQEKRSLHLLGQTQKDT